MVTFKRSKMIQETEPKFILFIIYYEISANIYIYTNTYMRQGLGLGFAYHCPLPSVLQFILIMKIICHIQNEYATKLQIGSTELLGLNKTNISTEPLEESGSKDTSDRCCRYIMS